MFRRFNGIHLLVLYTIVTHAANKSLTTGHNWVTN